MIDKDERDIVHTIYMNYDSIDNTSTNIYVKHLETVPAIFKDRDYADLAKEWRFANLIPSDYMEIDDALPESRDMEIDAVLPVSNEMDAGKGGWTPYTKEERGRRKHVYILLTK